MYILKNFVLFIVVMSEVTKLTRSAVIKVVLTVNGPMRDCDSSMTRSATAVFVNVLFLLHVTDIMEPASTKSCNSKINVSAASKISANAPSGLPVAASALFTPALKATFVEFPEHICANNSTSKLNSTIICEAIKTTFLYFIETIKFVKFIRLDNKMFELLTT